MAGVQSFGRRSEQPEEDLQGCVRLPAIVLPPARLRLELDLDVNRLEELFEAIRAGVYEAARRGLDEAVEDFSAEQREDAAAEDGAENSPPAAAGPNG